VSNACTRSPGAAYNPRSALGSSYQRKGVGLRTVAAAEFNFAAGGWGTIDSAAHKATRGISVSDEAAVFEYVVA